MSRQQMLEQLSHLARCAEPDGAKIQAMVQLARLEGYEEGGERPSEIIVRFGSPV